MSTEFPPQVMVNAAVEEPLLLDCLRKIGKGLVASGTAVGVVENTLNEIAMVYDQSCEIIALPNFLID